MIAANAMALIDAEILSAHAPHDSFDREALVRELTRDEGLELTVYYDTATPPRRTIGIGRNLDDVGIRPAENAALNITVSSCIAIGVTPGQAFYLCNSDIDAACADLDRVFPWWRSLSPVRQRVMLNWCFNMGVGRPASLLRKATGMQGFPTTMALIRANSFAAAANAMLASRWHSQVGKRVDRLAAMMLTSAAPSL